LVKFVPRFHREPDGPITSARGLRDHTGPHSRINLIRNLLPPDLPQPRLPASERLLELLRRDGVQGDDAAKATILPEPHLYGDPGPPSRFSPAMVN
jgi:hypothetical protein